MKTLDFNINDNVKVQLTDVGRRIYKEHYSRWMNEFEGYPKEDEDGFSTWQLWHLMSVYGYHIGMGLPMPFKTTIKIELNKLNEELENRNCTCWRCTGLKEDPYGCEKD